MSHYSHPFRLPLRLFWTITLILFMLVSTPAPLAKAAGVVGTGTPASCTEAALDAALAGGGTVTFDCGGVATITVTSTKTISANTTIDGGNLVTISGGDAVRILKVNAGVTLNINNLSLANGRGVNDGSGSAGGGALLNSGGTVNITTSTFVNNTAGEGRQGGAIINFFSSSMTITGSAFTNNHEAGVPGNEGAGGAIISYAPLTITNTTFSGNTGEGGGAIVNISSTLNITGSTFSNNSSGIGAGAGAIFNSGTTTIINSTFSGNNAPAGDGGGAIYNGAPSTLIIIGSTFSGNTATGAGGAILSGGGSNTAVLSITNSTFFGNSSTTFGGAIHNGFVPNGGASGNATLTNVTFAGNNASSGGALSNNSGSVTATNTILANSPSGGNCNGTITSGGNNLDSGNTCGFAASGDLINSDPLLSPLANNGGPTQTMALGTGSPAIDAGSNSICAASPVNNVDQRGFVRPVDGDGNTSANCDMGAFEVSGSLTALAPAQVWIGLKNSDDVGTHFDLLAEVYVNDTLVSSGQLNGVSGGSSGFNNAKKDTIAFNPFSAINVPAGATIKFKLSVRNACAGPSHNSGTARLWFNDSAANSQFGATIGSASATYYLGDGFNLLTSVGPGPKKTIDVAAGARCSPFKPFGTWTTTAPSQNQNAPTFQPPNS